MMRGSDPSAKEHRPTTSPHAPTPGRLRRWLGPFYFTGVFWYRFHLFGVSVVPDFLVAPIVLFFTVIFYVALGRVRRSVAANLEAVLGPCGFFRRQVRVWKTLHTFAWCLTERYEQYVPGKSFVDEIVESPGWRELRNADKGFVMVTAHLGNWEVAPALSTASSHRICNVVREKEIDPDSQRFLQELLATSESEVCRTHFAGEDPRLMLTLHDALRRGETVALQADRPRAGGRAVTVEICGIPMPLPIGPIVLARNAEVPAIPIFLFRTGRRKYRSVIREPIHVARTDDRASDIREAAAKIGSEIEWAVREAPHQWFCFTDLSASSSARGASSPSDPTRSQLPFEAAPG